MSSPTPNGESHEPEESQYTIGWICALQEEYEVACKMLDRRFKGPRTSNPKDDNTYEFGQISDHYVVIGSLPFGDYGTNSAAAVARDMVRSFPRLRFALLVGIGGGAPTRRDDIRLGDVVVGASGGRHGGVIQLDAVKRRKLLDGSISTQLWRNLNNPPNVLLRALPKVRARYNDPDEPDMIAENIKRMAKRLDFKRPSEDRLYRTDYPHQGGLNCDDCDIERLEPAAERVAGARVVKIHYGTIGSSNSLMKVVDERERYANDPDLRILCFEMEAAGLMNTIPCLVIRGICDYADSHKNDEWHKYAALTAAAYTRELLHVLQAERVTGQPSWNNVLDEVRTLRNDFRQDREDRRNGVALSWIAEDNDKKWRDDTHVNYYSKRHPGTGYWFENHPEFLAWVSGQARTLLCHGPPGAGKSVIAAIAIKHLLSRQNGEETKCAYLYCNYGRKDSVKQTANSLLSVLLRQLCEIVGLPNLIRDRPQRAPLSLQEISAALLEITRGYGYIFIVIDALDECSPDARETLLETMIELQGRTSLCLMVTSRGDFRAIQNRFAPCSKIEIKAVTEDVQAFIKDGIKHITHLSEHSLLRDYIPKKVAQTASSLFLSAKLQLESLKNTDTEQDIEDRLEKLSTGPKGLKKVYDESIERIDQLDHTQRHRTYGLLSWIFHYVYQSVGITIEQLEHALGVREGDTQFNQRNIPNVHSIISRCGGLVSFNKKRGVVEFAHETVHQYFKDNPNIFERNLVAQRYISLACVSYLSCFESRQLNKDDTLFYEYAASYLGYHARLAGPKTEIDNLILDFLGDETREYPAYDAIYDSNRFAKPDHKHWSKMSRPPLKTRNLHLAAYFGLEELVNYLLDHGVNIDATARGRRTALHSVIRERQDNIVRLLVQRGADINAQDSCGATPLHYASYCNNAKPLMELLIRANADTFAKDKFGATILHKLIRRLYNMNPYGNISPYTEAECSGSMELKIKSGVDLNARNDEGRTALSITIQGKYQILIKQLLDSGATVDAWSGIRAFETKAKNKLDGTDMIVLGHIAANPVERERFAAYHAAIEGQHEEVKRLLDPDKTLIGVHDPLLRVALIRSARQGHDAVVQVLLEAGLDCNAVDREFRPKVGTGDENECEPQLVLYEAAKSGQDSVVRIVLKAGADIEGKGFSNMTALHIAAQQGHKAVVRTLIDFGANIDARSTADNTPLDVAIRKKHFPIIRLLRGNLEPVSRPRKRRVND
ncbi:ankyrin repeat-containing domain protein [Annulohypoxylon nitens]|nr:ankyrin repeat-containing domain protein [Annulohypoxylon nitens]